MTDLTFQQRWADFEDMLNTNEITKAMAFPANYIIRGNRREKVKQAGNAVTPPAARDIIKTVAEVMSAT